MINVLLKSNDIEFETVKGYKNIIKWLSNFKETEDSKKRVVSLDIETKYLYLYKNILLGFGIGLSKQKSAYFVTRDLTIDQIRNIFIVINSFKSKIVLHNAYFDISQLTYMLGIPIKWDYDTYIMAHAVKSDILYYRKKDEDEGTVDSLSLKSLCYLYYRGIYGYEDTLDQERNKILKKLKMKKDDFTYDLFSDDILAPYGNADVVATYALYEGLLEEIQKHTSTGWEKLPDLLKLKHDVTKVYIKAKVRGIKIDRDMIMSLYNKWKPKSEQLYQDILDSEEVKEAELIWFSKQLDKKIASLKNDIQQKTVDKLREKCKFNISSPDQKKILFFDVMGLEPVSFNKITKTKKEKTPKTDKEFLQAYSYIPIVKMIEEYQLVVKGITGFLGVDDVEGKKGLWNLTFDEYPITHPNSNLQGTLTHRIAQDSPNFQQYASRGELAEMKRCIVPRYDNHRLVAFDYSSAELYILGALANEKNFKEAIHNNLDLHSSTAYQIWGKDMVFNDQDEERLKKELDKLKQKISKETDKSNLDYLRKEETDLIYILNIVIEFKNSINLMDNDILDLDTKMKLVKTVYSNTYRYHAKAINFGMPYGIGVSKLSKNIGKSIYEGSKILEQYRITNAGIANYMDSNKDFLAKYGYVEGMHNQRVYLHNALNYDWREDDSNFRALEELRKSTNYIIQSENAFVLYESLVSFDKEIVERNLDDKIIFLLSIYDAVYLSVDNSISESFVNELLKKHFEKPYYNGISFKIDISSGATMKEL